MQVRAAPLAAGARVEVFAIWMPNQNAGLAMLVSAVGRASSPTITGAFSRPAVHVQDFAANRRCSPSRERPAAQGLLPDSACSVHVVPGPDTARVQAKAPTSRLQCP